jgi:hypothetical protein
MPDEDTVTTPVSDATEMPTELAEATPSVIAGAEKSGDSSLPRDSVEAPPSIATNTKLSKEPALSKTTPKVTPITPENTGKHHELRVEPRIRVKWHADAFIDGKGVCQGFVKDISLKGTDIFLDLNLHKVKFLKLRIYVPPLSKKLDPYVIEVSANVMYTAYDSKESLFHTGVNFTKFNSESDQTYLQSRIATLNWAK